jgi:hypothetical protein
MDSELAYYRQQGVISNPASFSQLYEQLPDQVEDLVKVVQGTTIHVFWADRYGFQIPPERMEEVQLRTMQRRLSKTQALDSRPLTEARSLDKKLIGNCRDFSLFLASLLRYKGFPARARCGFGAYFLPGHYEDHWVTEYFNSDEQRWVLVDAQLDRFQRAEMKISFNPLDVPRDQFIVAGKAWQLCRTGQADPQSFGIFDMHGLGFVLGNLVRDLAALNKVELLPWDCWGIILQEDFENQQDLAVLDHAAALIADEIPDFEAVLSIYQSDTRFRMDGILQSYIDGTLVQQELDV